MKLPMILLLLACVGAGRTPVNDDDMRYWLENTIVYHGFSREEAAAAMGMSDVEVQAAIARLKIDKSKPEKIDSIRVLPYPGGRHPRIGFLEGAIDPQRETKVSVFTPWDPASYVVVDVPEAIFTDLGLTYLAHKHIPTIWDQKGVELEELEWKRTVDGLEMERKLPNGIAFGTKVRPEKSIVRMEIWLRNGTERPLRDIRMQVCVMCKAATGFEGQTKENKALKTPYAACRSADGKRWVITAWEPCHRTWQNPPVPCMHSDPKMEDVAPGEVKSVRGVLWFHEGQDLEAEIERMEKTGWRQVPR